MSPPPAAPEPLEPRPDPEHDARVVQAIARAHTDIPFYAKRGRAPIEPGSSLDDVLRATPLLTKADIRTTLPKQWVPASVDVKAALASGDIELVETSGSTQERLRILWDKGWWMRQEDRAMRTNPLVVRAHRGDFGPYKETILTTPVCGLATCHVGDLPLAERIEEHRLFLNMRADPTFWREGDMDRMLDELAEHQTVGLETDPMYFATLARYAASHGRTIDVKGFAQLTYAFTTHGHIRGIRQAYGGPLLQLYGASEVGVLFMEGDDARLHHAPFTTHVELLPCKVATPGAKNVALVVVTTLDRVAQPLVRFVVGDLVQVDPNGPKRFTSVPSISTVEGRVQDSVLRPDGAIVTCAAIDRALATCDVAVLQVNQRDAASVEVDVVPEPGRDARAIEAARAALAPLFEGLAFQVRSATAIAAEPSGKFRVARREFPIDLARSFEGCDGVKL
jgi:phenylacetate-coenzyme A ligase PaaK-like adenylate-forming protein